MMVPRTQPEPSAVVVVVAVAEVPLTIATFTTMSFAAIAGLGWPGIAPRVDCRRVCYYCPWAANGRGGPPATEMAYQLGCGSGTMYMLEGTSAISVR